MQQRDALGRGAGLENARAVELHALGRGIDHARALADRLFHGDGIRHAEADHQRGDAGHVGRRHRRAAVAGEALALVAALIADRLLHDVNAGSRDVDPVAARGELGELVVGPGGADADDAVGGAGELHVPAGVAGGGDDDGALRERVVDRLLEHARVARAAKAEVDHLGAVLGRPADAVGDVGRGARAGLAQHLHRHQPRVKGDADPADGVVGRLRDRPGDMRPVALIVVGVLVLGDEVPPAHALRLREIAALGEGAVRLAGDACIDDGDGDAAPGGEVPGSGRADALHVPLVLHQRVVGDEEGANAGERLGALDARIVREAIEQLGLAIDAHGGELGVRLRGEGGGPEGEPEVTRQGGDFGVIEIVLGVDDDLAGDVVRRGVEVRPPVHRLVCRGGELAQIAGRASVARPFCGGVTAQEGTGGE